MIEPGDGHVPAIEPQPGAAALARVADPGERDPALACGRRHRLGGDRWRDGHEQFVVLAVVEGVFEANRRFFGPKRRDGARKMRFGEWGGLRTARALRIRPVSVPVTT